MFWALFANFNILGPFWQENGRGRHIDAFGSWASKLDQKVGTRWGPLGSTIVLE